jgi:signal transduction histidine kinase
MPSTAKFGLVDLYRSSFVRFKWARPWHRRMAAMHPVIKWLFAVTATVAVAYTDIVSGDELSFSIFYFFPIAYATWFIRSEAGLLMAILGVAVWTAIELRHGAITHPLIPYWNGAMRLAFFFIAVAAVAQARRTESNLLREVLRRMRELRIEAERRRKLERQMIEVSAREQVRMAQDLHDGLGQYLSALSFHAGILADDLRQHASPFVAQAERLVAVIRMTNQITRQLDRVMQVPQAGHGDFFGAVRQLLADLEQLTGVRCDLSAPEHTLNLDDFRTVMLFRIVQEALNNAVKHAQPRLIRVSLSTVDDMLNIVVLDDGHGLTATSDREPGSGIRVMKLRAELIGARLEFGTADTGGCRVQCTVPVKARVTTP